MATEVSTSLSPPVPGLVATGTCELPEPSDELPEPPELELLDEPLFVASILAIAELILFKSV